MNASFTDAELERGFEITKAIGAEVMTTSTTMDVARPAAPLADKHKVIVGLHGHSNITDPKRVRHAGKLRGGDEDVALSEGQPRHRSLLAADYDPIAYIREHHAKITNLHLKDRKKHQGDNTPWDRATRRSRKCSNC